MTDTNTQLDIFAPPAPPPVDEQILALTREVDDLRVQLNPMIKSAPPVANESLYLEKEEWCRRWTRLITSLTNCVHLGLKRNFDIQLTEAERQDGKTGNTICDTLQRQVSAMKETAAQQARKAQANKDVAVVAAVVEDEQTQNEKDEDEVREEVQDDDAQEHEAPEDDAEVEEPSIKRSTRIYSTKRVASRVPSESDVEILPVAPSEAEVVVQKRKTPRIRATKGDVNTTPCEKCAGIGRTCYKSDVGLVCWDCKRLKIRCSFVTAKGKGKQKATPPPKPTPAAPKPRPSPLSKAGPSPKAKPAPAPAPKGKGKVEDAPTLPAAPPRTAPGPLVTQRAYVDLPRSNLTRNGKRKAAEINVDSSEGERDDDADEDDDDDDEDAYMAGRVNGLHTFVAMFETAFGALKKEVTEIDGYLVRKRRRHRR